MPFTIGKTTLEYFDHPYNNTAVNERRVEIPLAMNFINKTHDSLLEVGCVMPYYMAISPSVISYNIIDMFDLHPRCLAIDARGFNYTNENVLSISTIEHIGTSDYGATAGDPHSAFDCLNKIIKQAKNYLITWPVGYNKILDDDLRMSDIDYIILERTNAANEWQESNYMRPYDRAELQAYKYSEPFTCGNAIVIITNLEDYK